MNLDHVTKLLPAYLDKELDNATSAMVKGHLEGCAACREEENLLAASWDLLGAVETIRPSPEFRARFWERVRREEDRRSSWLAWPRLVPVFAGFIGVWAVGAGLGMYLFLNQAGPSIRQSQTVEGISLAAAYARRLPEDGL